MKYRAIVYLLVWIGLAALFSRADGADAREKDISWGPSAAGCRLSISSDQDRYTLGEPIQLSMLFHNGSDTNVQILGFPQDPTTRGVRIKVKSSRGETIPYTRAGELREIDRTESSIRFYPLAPGETVVVTDPIFNNYFDMSLLGEYRVTVQWVLAEPLDNDGKPIVVTSNELVIRIDNVPERGWGHPSEDGKGGAQ